MCGFTTEMGNIYSCEVVAQFVYTITNEGANTLSLDNLAIEYDIGDGTVTESRNLTGQQLGSGQQTTEESSVFTIDTSTEKNITAQGDVTGFVPGFPDDTCMDSAMYSERVGPIPPVICIDEDDMMFELGEQCGDDGGMGGKGKGKNNNDGVLACCEPAH